MNSEQMTVPNRSNLLIMNEPNGTKPLAMALIFAVVFGVFFIGLKLFVFWKTGEFSRIDIIEVITLIGAIFVGAFLQFFFQNRKK
jgi:hypothetical protein